MSSQHPERQDRPGRLRRLVGAGAILILVALIGLWYALPTLVAQQLRNGLTAAGAEAVEIKVDAIGTDFLAIERLSLTLPDRTTRLHAEELRISFNPERVIRAQSIETIDAGHVDVSVSGGGPPTLRTPFLGGIAFIRRLSTLNFDTTRFERIRIADLSLMVPGGLLQTEHLQAEIESVNGRLEGSITTGADTPHREISFLANATEYYQIVLTAQASRARDALVVKMSAVKGTPTPEVRLRLEGDAERLHEWLRPFAVSPPLPVDRGNVAIDGRLGGTELEPEFDLEVSLSGVAGTAWTVRQLRLVASGALQGPEDDLQLTFDAPVMLSAVSADGRSWSLAQGEATLDAAITIRPDLLDLALSELTVSGSGIETDGLTTEHLSIGGEGEIAYRDGHWSAALTKATARLAQLRGEDFAANGITAEGALTASGDFRNLTVAASRVVGEQLSADDWFADQINITGEATFEGIDGDTVLSLRPGTRVIASRIAQPDTVIVSSTDLTARAAARLSNWQGYGGEWAGTIGQIEIPGTALITPVELILAVDRFSATASETKLDVSLSTPSMQLSTDPVELSLVDVSGDIQWRPDVGQMVLKAQLPDRQTPVSARIAQDPETESGSLQFTLGPHQPGTGEPSLSAMMSGWPAGLSLLSGEVALDGVFHWGKDGAEDLLTLEMIDVGGAFADFYFSGVDARIPFQVEPAFQTQTPSEVSVSTVDAGIALHDINGRLSVDHPGTGDLPRVTLEDVSLRLLGGGVTSPRIELDLNGTDFEFTVLAEAIDLSQLVQLQQVDYLTVSGRVSGTLPIRLSEGNIGIVDGTLFSLPPGGEIRIDTPEQGDGLKGGTSGTALAAKALRDFRFHHLEAHLDLGFDGELRSGLQLEGHSPEISKDQPIHLNINVEQNLRSMLESVRYVQGLSESLDKKVREYYERGE